MRVEISYKFIVGFIVVVASIVALNLLVPHLGIPEAWRQLFTVACAILVGLLFGWFFSRRFSTNIRIINASAESLGNGDLSMPVVLPETAFPDETGDLAASLNRVIDSLRVLVGAIRASSVTVAESAQGLSATSEQMSTSSHEIARAIEQISRGAETQAEMVEKSSTLIKEMAASIEVIAASASKASQSANATAATAQRGGQLSQATIGRMKQVLENVERNGEQIASFGLQVQKIGKIVEVITGIAGKTNLLALNATIEAARAGEYGRGFAVVAEEIRKLADSTEASAAEITQLIETIREEAGKVQESMKTSIQDLDAGRAAVDDTGRAFEAIIGAALNTQSKTVAISEMAQKQTDGAAGMVAAVEEIARVAEDNAAATEEVSAATEEQTASMEEMAEAAQGLSELAEELLEAVERFRLESAKV
ncbi:methyl-accepting chemotaxis protein [Trichloromonas sp.]|uniref:methyl-accepting chemotaxis protein n=1 Tax=Trichloromonas sp. TaxID=3069249 RepID=UPI002A4D1923|nr:HAMP domain-containing methyl-accepting chemotaxis protein [Trichloromonas sp.]